MKIFMIVLLAMVMSALVGATAAQGMNADPGMGYPIPYCQRYLPSAC